MASLRTNFVLPIAAMGFFGLTGYAVYAVTSEEDQYVATAGETKAVPSVFGLDADNTADTLRAVQATVEQQRADQRRLEELNAELARKTEAALDAKLATEKNVESAVREAVEAERQLAAKRATQLEENIGKLGEMMVAMQRQLDAKPTVVEVTREPLESEIVPDFGFGLDGELSGAVIDGERLIDTVWINPLDRPLQGTDGDEGGFTPLGAASSLRNGISNQIRRTTGSAQASSDTARAVPAVSNTVAETERYYTLPDLSVLSGGVVATSLVGRVYSDDIKDPWPFKVSIARDNFTANFMALPPEIDGMLFEGYAVGDWTLSCTRGHLIAASFVFADGTVVKAYGTDVGSRPREAQITRNTIGYIADPFGNPCIAGEKHTSAPSYLAARMLAAGAEGYGVALGDAEISRERVTNANGTFINEVVTGDVGAYAGAKALEEGADETASWLRERQGQIFDLVYTKSGSPVDVHLQQEIYIDKKPDARKVRYATGVSRYEDLD